MKKDLNPITGKKKNSIRPRFFSIRLRRVGFPNKTLNIALAGTGVGKSLFMCHVASSVLLQGKNVLYITLEMKQKRRLLKELMLIF